MNLISLSENTLLILFEQKIKPSVFQQVTECSYRVESVLADYIIDIIPAYASLQLSFNLSKISHKQFKKLLLDTVTSTDIVLPSTIRAQSTISIPIYYGPEVALDLELIAHTARLSTEEVITIHSSVTYDVYAMGFAPGFAYLGNVDSRIALPRKSTPRPKIVRGSLGIADRQTAIYPADSPGGWQILGRTPVAMIDYKQESLTQFAVGDRVKFVPIEREEYLRLGGEL